VPNKHLLIIRIIYSSQHIARIVCSILMMTYQSVPRTSIKVLKPSYKRFYHFGLSFTFIEAQHPTTIILPDSRVINNFIKIVPFFIQPKARLAIEAARKLLAPYADFSGDQWNQEG
jgi:hypothetical protein